MKTFIEQRPGGAAPSSREFVQAQANVREVLDDITSRAHVFSNIIEDLTLTAATTYLVAHKLGRTYTGWRVVDKTANSVVYRVTTSTADKSKFLALLASANVTISVEVF